MTNSRTYSAASTKTCSQSLVFHFWVDIDDPAHCSVSAGVRFHCIFIAKMDILYYISDYVLGTHVLRWSAGSTFILETNIREKASAWVVQKVRLSHCVIVFSY